MIHVAIVTGAHAQAIVGGSKAIEARLTRNRVAPFGRVRVGERIYFKISSGPFAVTARVEAVEGFEPLTRAGVRTIRARFNAEIGADAAFWIARRDARFGTLIRLADPEAIEFGPDYRSLPGWSPRAAWFVLPVSACVYPWCLGAGVRLVRADGRVAAPHQRTTILPNCSAASRRA